MIITQFFGYEAASEYQGLLIWAVVIGMGGSMFSLFASKFLAKMSMGVKIIDPQSMDSNERRLTERIHQFARQAGLRKMPEVGVYDSPEINAFATGPSKNNSLVAVSSGILTALDNDELDGVLAHEVSHIANGDMVTMTLIQGIINTLVFFIARIIARVILQDSNSRGFGTYFMVIMGLQIVLSLLGSIVVNYFSRWREFRADAGSAKIAGRDKMIKALQRLQQNTDLIDSSHESMASLKISNKPGGLMAMLFSTHPPLEDRIKRLQTGR